LQSSRMSIFWLAEEFTQPPRSLGDANGLLTRSSETRLADLQEGSDSDELGDRMLVTLGSHVDRPGPPREPDPPGELAEVATPLEAENFSPAALGRLKEVNATLSSGASRGEVLPLVMKFASETFSRVAMFMVRGDMVVGMAQRGLSELGGPDDLALQKISIGRDDCAWFRQVFDCRSPVVSAPADDGDRMLASYLGETVPELSYAAPIVSSGQIVALLYADNLPGNAPPGDTSALEVVLQHAGLALERAVLERALAEMES
jgi:hypothetical protein